MLKLMTSWNQLRGKRALKVEEFDGTIILVFRHFFACIGGLQCHREHSDDPELEVLHFPQLASEYHISTEREWKLMIELGVATSEEQAEYLRRQRIHSEQDALYQERLEFAEYNRLHQKWKDRTPP